MRIFSLVLSTLFFISTSALALEELFENTSARVATVQNMTEARYFENRRIVSQMRGVVSAGTVESNAFGEFDIRTISGRDTVCITVGDECFVVAPSLSKDSIVRIGHWAVQGNFKVFSCLRSTSPEARSLIDEGFANAGRSGADCGNRFVHPTLNSAEFVSVFSYIDFDNNFASPWNTDRSNCRTDRSTLVRANRVAATGRATVSYVNMDIGKVYRVSTSRNSGVPVLRFSGSPSRNHWVLPSTGSAIVFARCPAKRPDTSSQRRAVAFFHVAALFREAASRDNRSVIEFINEHAKGLR